jgi:hypothetical protein
VAGVSSGVLLPLLLRRLRALAVIVATAVATLLVFVTVASSSSSSSCREFPPLVPRQRHGT